MPGVSGVFAFGRGWAGRQMGASGTGGSCVYLWWWCPCFGIYVWSVGHWGILAELVFRLLGLNYAHRVLPNFLFLLYHTLYSFLFFVTLQSCVIN